MQCKISEFSLYFKITVAHLRMHRRQITRKPTECVDRHTHTRVRLSLPQNIMGYGCVFGLGWRLWGFLPSFAIKDTHTCPLTHTTLATLLSSETSVMRRPARWPAVTLIKTHHSRFLWVWKHTKRTKGEKKHLPHKDLVHSGRGWGNNLSVYTSFPLSLTSHQAKCKA